MERAFETTVAGEWRCVQFIACPSVLLPLEGRLSRWTAAIDALYRIPWSLPLDPVVFAGIGIQRSALDWSQPQADITLPAFSFDGTEPVYRLGAGVQYPIGKLSVFAEIEARGNRFGAGSFVSSAGKVNADRKLLFDIGLGAGVRIDIHK